MAAKIQKWGNSLGVRIPKAIIDQADLIENSEVEIQHKNGTIVIFPVKRKLSLKALLGKITDENLHKIADDAPVGDEVW